MLFYIDDSFQFYVYIEMILMRFFFFFLLIPLAIQSQQIELGNVDWLRDYDEALAQSKAQDKAVFILFQEVPGCATCRNYGSDVLSHPLIVDAIENEFIPLAIFNNKGGKDAAILKKFKEPSWNNPVVRIINSSETNVIDRVAGKYDKASITFAMIKALQEEAIPVPEYLQLMLQEFQAQKMGVSEAYYSMYCFWSGEGHLAKHPAVVATEPGWMSGKEVVKVYYNENLTNKKTLDKFAKEGSCQLIEKSNGYRPDKDLQYYLKNTLYRHLPLSAIQASKINAALAEGLNPMDYLSPSQTKWLLAFKEKSIKDKTLYYEMPLSIAWKQLVSKEGA